MADCLSGAGRRSYPHVGSAEHKVRGRHSAPDLNKAGLAAVIQGANVDVPVGYQMPRGQHSQAHCRMGPVSEHSCDAVSGIHQSHPLSPRQPIVWYVICDDVTQLYNQTTAPKHFAAWIFSHSTRGGAEGSCLHSTTTVEERTHVPPTASTNAQHLLHCA